MSTDSAADRSVNSLLPPMHWLRQEVASSALTTDQIQSAVRSGVAQLRLRPGQSIGIAVGSRGIDKLVLVVRALVDSLRDSGQTSFVFPAMGSHGGATAEGQRDVLASLGITAETIGCEVRSSMQTTQVATLSSGMPVLLDAFAARADGIIAINRIKPHTHFRGRTESGLTKMLIIGAGKHDQAAKVHAHGVDGLRDLIPDMADQLIATGRVLAGVALCEDGNHHISTVRVIRGSEIPIVEPELLTLARAMMPSLPVPDVDLLIVDRIGKDISGTGMDTNIVGRVRALDLVGFASPRVRVIYARALTDTTHGNAIGMGLADLVHQQLADAVDPVVTGINAMTGGSPATASLPITAATDRQALEYFNMFLRGARTLEDARIIRIRDTLTLNRILVSEAVVRELAPEKRDVSPYTPSFDSSGNFP